MQKPLALSIGLLALAGCSASYIAPEPVLAPTLGQPVTAMTTEQTLPVSISDAWKNIQDYSSERYRTIRQNKSNGELSLFVDAFEPDSAITCGMVQSQNGMFDSHREFLALLAQQTPVNLDITVHIKLTAKSPKQTAIAVNTDYEMAVGYQTNPGTGAIIGGARYQFNSRGSANVAAPGGGFAARCQPTGSVETGIINAARGN